MLRRISVVDSLIHAVSLSPCFTNLGNVRHSQWSPLWAFCLPWRRHLKNGITVLLLSKAVPEVSYHLWRHTWDIFHSTELLVINVSRLSVCSSISSQLWAFGYNTIPYSNHWAIIFVACILISSQYTTTLWSRAQPTQRSSCHDNVCSDSARSLRGSQSSSGVEALYNWKRDTSTDSPTIRFESLQRFWPISE